MAGIDANANESTAGDAIAHDTAVTLAHRHKRGPSSDPVGAAYCWYTAGKPRESWDPLTMLYAIEGLGEVFEVANVGGHNYVDPDDGHNEWIMVDNDKQPGCRFEWLKLKVTTQEAEQRLDNMYLAAAWATFDRRTAVLGSVCSLL